MNLRRLERGRCDIQRRVCQGLQLARLGGTSSSTTTTMASGVRTAAAEQVRRLVRPFVETRTGASDASESREPRCVPSSASSGKPTINLSLLAIRLPRVEPTAAVGVGGVLASRDGRNMTATTYGRKWILPPTCEAGL
nr:PREDICTED: uncharacterized protein LOC103982030 [Musa acuminata subsp. malaccensis]